VYTGKDVGKLLQTVSKKGTTEGVFSLPLTYWVAKTHKKVPKARFTAGSANVLTTRLAQVLVVNVLLVEVKKELKRRVSK